MLVLIQLAEDTDDVYGDNLRFVRRSDLAVVPMPYDEPFILCAHRLVQLKRHASESGDDPKHFRSPCSCSFILNWRLVGDQAIKALGFFLGPSTRQVG